MKLELNHDYNIPKLPSIKIDNVRKLYSKSEEKKNFKWHYLINHETFVKRSISVFWAWLTDPQTN